MPHFKQTMFNCWMSEDVTEAIVGFPKESKMNDDFRNKLILEMTGRENNYFLYKVENDPEDVVKVFDKTDANTVTTFYNKKTPGFLDMIFKTRIDKAWKDEVARLEKLVKVQFVTSDMFPCFFVTTTIHSPDDLSKKILDVAQQLSIEIYKNSELESFNNIDWNHTFDVRVRSNRNG